MAIYNYDEFLNENSKSEDYSNVEKRLQELKNEFYELEVSWKKNKDFQKLDRKRIIQNMFKELGIPLKDWSK